MSAQSVGDAWRLRNLLPRSMTGLIAASCLVAAAPMLTAVILASLALERLSVHSGILVDEGIKLERLGMELQHEIHRLDRNIRQYEVVRDPELLQLFVERASKLKDVLQRIEARGFQVALGDHTRAVDEGADEVISLVTGENAADAPVDAVLSRLRDLRQEAGAIAASGGAAIDSEIAELSEASQLAQQVIFLSAVAFAPLTALLAFALSYAVSRPLQHMARGASDLGHGRYEQPIIIKYPREMERLGEKLDWLRQRLAQLEADKAQFLRHVSHELKNPLATIREGVDLLRQGALGPSSPPQIEVAEILHESTTGLDLQIRRLLAFAKWREGKEGESAWFDSSGLIQEVLRAHKPSMMKRSLVAKVDVGAHRLFGVRDQLRVALENIVVNAIRHAPSRSTIELGVRACATSFALCVRDYGPGVPESSKRRIFEPYVRGENNEAASVRGSGLGLSIVEEIVLSHDGVVEVEDANPGARFTMLWPRPEEGAVGAAT